MTVFSKLIGAGSVLAVGYVAASLVGSPTASSLTQPAGVERAGALAPALAGRWPNGPADPAAASGRARLVPDVPAADSPVPPRRPGDDRSRRTRPASDAAVENLSQLPSEKPEVSPSELQVPELLEPAPSDSRAAPLPRAKLKDARVRPLSTDPHAAGADTAVIGSTPLLPPGEVNAASFTAADTLIRAAEGTATKARPRQHNAPLREIAPWGESGHGDFRSHIVRDGDSLARLARRYLGDETRSNEIFELNGELLANPELLPIGAELRIPPRSSRAARPIAVTPRDSGRMVEPSRASSAEVSAVRPIPAEPTVAPRAKLLRPLPAERPDDGGTVE